MSYVHKTTIFVTLCFIVLAQRTEPPIDYEYQIPQICEMLINADNELVGKFQNMVNGEAESVMKQVREFNDNLTSIIERHKKSMKRDINDTILEASPLIDHGAPQFINFYSDRDTLEQAFGMNNISSRIMECQRQNTIDIWEDFVWFYDTATAEKGEDESSEEIND